MLSETQRDHEAKTRAILEEAREAQERGRQFLQLSMGQHKKEEAVEEGKKKAQLESKVKAIVSLKRNIESSRVSMISDLIYDSLWERYAYMYIYTHLW